MDDYMKNNNSENKKDFNEKFIRNNSKKITDEDILKVTEAADKIEKKFTESGPLKRFIEDGKLLLSIVKDYFKGNYKKVPYWAIGAIAFTLLYVLNPADFMPDVLPFVGLIDDATLVGVCLYLVEKELKDYKIWKSGSSINKN